MGGASRGRVAKKQRSTKTPTRPTRTSIANSASASGSTDQQNQSSRRSQPARSMRRGSRRPSRSAPAEHHYPNLSAIDDLFNRFKEPGEEKIGPEGMETLFQELKINPLDIVALIFAWKLKGTVPCEFTREQFVNGCIDLEVDSIDNLRKVMPLLKESLNEPSDFRSFYMFAFEYNKPPEQRSMPIEIARQLFPLILNGRFQHLGLWLEFLNERKHAISRDTYSLLLDFALTIHSDMSNYDEENGAWPVLLDEFVDFAKPKLNDKMDD